MANFTIKQMSPQLSVADMERAIGFYTQKLGFQVEFRYEDFYAGIVSDGYSIHLKLTDHPKKVEKHTDDSPLEIQFSVENIEHLYEALIAKEVQFVQSLRQQPYGKEFNIIDPDGNVIAYVESAGNN